MNDRPLTTRRLGHPTMIARRGADDENGRRLQRGNALRYVIAACLAYEWLLGRTGCLLVVYDWRHGQVASHAHSLPSERQPYYLPHRDWFR